MDKMKQYGGTLSESRGASGGLATLCNNIIWKHKDTTVNQNWIKMTLENCTYQKTIIVYNIYVPIITGTQNFVGAPLKKT